MFLYKIRLKFEKGITELAKSIRICVLNSTKNLFLNPFLLWIKWVAIFLVFQICVIISPMSEKYINICALGTGFTTFVPKLWAEHVPKISWNSIFCEEDMKRLLASQCSETQWQCEPWISWVLIIPWLSYFSFSSIGILILIYLHY